MKKPYRPFSNGINGSVTDRKTNMGLSSDNRNIFRRTLNSSKPDSVRYNVYGMKEKEFLKSKLKFDINEGETLGSFMLPNQFTAAKDIYTRVTGRRNRSFEPLHPNFSLPTFKQKPSPQEEFPKPAYIPGSSLSKGKSPNMCSSPEFGNFVHRRLGSKSNRDEISVTTFQLNSEKTKFTKEKEIYLTASRNRMKTEEFSQSKRKPYLSYVSCSKELERKRSP
jgi:hypothetical protein